MNKYHHSLYDEILRYYESGFGTRIELGSLRSQMESTKSRRTLWNDSERDEDDV